MSDESYFSSQGVTVAMDEVGTLHKLPLHKRVLCQPAKIAIQQAIGVFPPGQVHAIVSPNSKNAQHALYVLSGTRPPHQGDVTVQNIPVNTSVFRRMVGWVRRRQAPYDLLSNRRNVTYHLRRKRVRASSSEEEGRADAVLGILGLDPQQKARLNDPLQQLLLQLAMELAWDPPVIFVKDPTEGLASFEHKRIGSVLHNLAVRLGKTVFLSTDRLPLALYEKVDTLLVIGEGGHTFYSGPISGVKPYFESLGLSETYAPMPQKTTSTFEGGGGAVHSNLSSQPPLPLVQDASSTTDSLNNRSSTTPAADTSTGRDGTTHFPPMLERAVSSTLGGNEPPQQHLAKASRYFTWETSRDKRPLQVTDGETVLDLAKLWSECEEDTCQYAVSFFDSPQRLELMRQIRVMKGLERPNEGDVAKGGASTGAFLVPEGGLRNLPFKSPNLLFRIFNLLMADAEQSIRRVELFLSVACVLLVLVLCGWAMSHIVDMDQDGMQNVRGIIFFLFLMAQELNLTLIDSLREEVEHYIDQRRSGTTSSLLFICLFLTKLLLGRVVLLSVVAGFFFYAMQNSNANTSNFVILWGLHSVTHLLLVFLVVVAPISTKAVRVVCFAISGYFALMSGFLINLPSIPVVWVQYSSLLRYGYGAVLNKYLANKPYSCDASLASNVTSYCYTGDQYLELEGLVSDTTDRSAQVYAITVAVLAVLCWLRLHFMRK